MQSVFSLHDAVGVGWVWFSLQILTDPFTALQIPNLLQLSPMPVEIFSVDYSLPLIPSRSSSPLLLGPKALTNCNLLAYLRFIRNSRFPYKTTRISQLSSIALSSPQISARYKNRNFRTRSHTLIDSGFVKGNSLLRNSLSAYILKQ